MLGITIGDIVGSRFEFDNCRSTEFELFHPACDFTDDTVCATAVADWVLQGCTDNLVPIMQDWCRRYPNPVGAYGERFQSWVQAASPEPYNSWGNGSAMRVAAVGWAFDTLEQTLEAAAQSAAITHNHPGGINGAQAVAAAIFWARTGESKDFIREQTEQQFGYFMGRTCDEIRPTYLFNVSCEGTVPQALTAFLESNDFEHAIRLAVSLGGDSDTLTAITGAVAEAFYGIPNALREHTLAILPRDIAETLLAFEARFGNGQKQPAHCPPQNA